MTLPDLREVSTMASSGCSQDQAVFCCWVGEGPPLYTGDISPSAKTSVLPGFAGQWGPQG